LKVASLFSGGKDSAFALWYAQMQGWEIVSLVTIIPESKESWMFHYPAVKWTGLQAEAMGIPRMVIHTKGIKEDELEDLRSGLRMLIKSTGIEGIVSGAVASEYQRTRLDNICEELGLRSFAPLWHKNQQQLVREQIDCGFEIIVTACSALGLTSNWLGRRLNHASLDELMKLSQKHGLSVAFEGGEAETFVLTAPMFNGTIQVVRSHSHWSGESGYLELEELLLKQS
jgi:ABC transporter with metal-binding/Fe-S-binding domain ATP-binding protein